VQCKNCSFLRSFPYPEPTDSISHYDETYYLQSYFASEAARRAAWAEHIREINALMTPGKVLDVGCGVGFFLDVARQRGWEVVGVEPAVMGARFVREHYGINVFPGFLSDAPFPQASFDLVTFWNVLAHVAEPQEVVTQAQDLLKPQGLLAIKTGHRPARVFRIVNFLFGAHRELGRPLLHLPGQMNFFTPDTLTQLLYSVGFEIIKVQPVSEVKKPFPKDKWLKPKSVGFFLMNSLLIAISKFQSFIVYARKKDEQQN